MEPITIEELAAMIAEDDDEIMRAGKRQLWDLVHKVGRPGNGEQQNAVKRALLKLMTPEQPAVVKREVIWMLSEIGADCCVAPMADLLSDAELREDARMALQRLPGDKSLEALEDGLRAAPDDFKTNIAQSLRARGVNVPGLPCEKLEPMRETTVQPVGR